MEPAATESRKEIDVTGLPEQAIQAVQSVVRLLRLQFGDGEQVSSSPNDWARAIGDWAESHVRRAQAGENGQKYLLPSVPVEPPPPPPPFREDWWELPVDPAIAASTPPEILAAEVTYYRELPELLKERRGQWVAYYGSRRLGFATTEDALWQECERQGYRDFYVRRVESEPPFHYI
jgi:hypothetical protein